MLGSNPMHGSSPSMTERREQPPVDNLTPKNPGLFYFSSVATASTWADQRNWSIGVTDVMR